MMVNSCVMSMVNGFSSMVFVHGDFLGNGTVSSPNYSEIG